MRNNYISVDDEQTKRLKEICLSSCAYSCIGEIYKLLNCEILQKLINKIPKQTIKLKSDLLYGKDTISSEEKFLENLDKYISYVKDNYFIQHNELTLIIELTLKNKYNEVLFDMDDYHENENYMKYHDAFRKMFLFNFYNNIKFYSKYVSKYNSINIFLNEIKFYKFNNSKDIIMIEERMSKIINNRFSNIYNAFVPYEEIEKQHYEFYIQQIDWIISDFYENQLYRFDIKDNDHHINLHDGDKIIFNVLNNKEKVSIKFGIINRNFCADKIVVFTQKEFKEILERLKKIDVSKKYDTTYSFIDSSLKFNFWNEQKMQFLDIIFEYNNNSTNKYMISLDSRDTKKLYKLISKQVNKKI